MPRYLSVYTHQNRLIYESSSAGTERILAYSATEIVDHLLQQTALDYFPGAVQYNGARVSCAVLPNGYKLFGVFAGQAADQEILLREAGRVAQAVLDPDYDEFEEFCFHKILAHGTFA